MEGPRWLGKKQGKQRESSKEEGKEEGKEKEEEEGGCWEEGKWGVFK